MSPAFYKVAAVAAGLTAITTFLLWGLPKLTPDGVPPVELRLRPEYMGRLWVNFAHEFLALLGYGAAASLVWRRSPGLAATSFIAFLVWAAAEAQGVAINIFAVNKIWREKLAHDASSTAQANLDWFAAWWDGQFFLLVVCFLIGTTCLGLAAVKGRGVQRWAGGFLLLATPLTIGIILSEVFYLSVPGLAPILDCVYPVLQPVGRAMLGLWLWTAAHAMQREAAA